MNLVHLENDDALPGVASENPSKQLVRTQNNGFWNGLQERNISVQILAIVSHDILRFLQTNVTMVSGTEQLTIQASRF